MFCVDQHDPELERNSLPWVVGFEEIVETIRHTVVLCSPWHDIEPFHRIWCLLEIHHTPQIHLAILHLGAHLHRNVYSLNFFRLFYSIFRVAWSSSAYQKKGLQKDLEGVWVGSGRAPQSSKWSSRSSSSELEMEL